jgi:hypothetical protein
MTTSITRPRTSGSVEAIEDSAYAALGDGKKRIVSLVIDKYLSKAKETGPDYEARVQTLRNQFSTEAKLQELVSSSQMGHRQYNPGYAKPNER